MNVVIWIVQGLLAFAFLMAGSMKLMRSRGQLREQMGWVDDFSQGFVRTIGALEVLAAVGLILPMLFVLGLIMIPAGATIAVESNTDTNGKIPEPGGTAWHI